MVFLSKFKVGEWYWVIVLSSYILERLFKGDTEGLMVWWYFVLYLGGVDAE